MTLARRRLLRALAAAPLLGLPGVAGPGTLAAQEPPAHRVYLPVLNAAPPVDVRTYGAVGDGEADDTAAIRAAIAAARPGATLLFPASPAFYRVTSTVRVEKPLALVGAGGEVRMLTPGRILFRVAADGVTLRGLRLVGRGPSRDSAAHAVAAVGASAATPLRDVRVEDCVIRDWGFYGVYLKWIDGFRVERNDVRNIYYAGVMGESVRHGVVQRNAIDTVVGAPNAYGIALTRATTDDLLTDPRSSDVLVAFNDVANVLRWEGIDTHAGERITILGNRVTGCHHGIVVTMSPKLTGEVPTWAPRDCVLRENVVVSGKTDGSAGYGIVVSGAYGRLGAPAEYATGILVETNTVRDHGDQANNINGALHFQATRGLVCRGNAVVNPSPIGVCWYSDNVEHVCEGNTVADPWTTAGGEAVGIYARTDFNTGYWGANSVARGGKAATRVLDHAQRVADQPNNRIELGPPSSGA